MINPTAEQRQWARHEWGSLTASFVVKVAPFAVWAAAQEADGSFVMPPRTALFRLWRVTRVMFFAIAAQTIAAPFVSWAILAAVTEDATVSPFHSETIETTIDFVGGGLMILFLTAILTQANRGRFYAFLARIASSGQAGRAAGIAALVGKADPARTLQIARKNFRGVRFSDLLAESFESSADSGLNERATRHRLGEIDVFLSHSWVRCYASIICWSRANWPLLSRAPADRHLVCVRSARRPQE